MEVDLTYYNKRDAECDYSDTTPYGRVDEDRTVSIKISRPFNSKEVSYGLEVEECAPGGDSGDFEKENRSNEGEFLAAMRLLRKAADDVTAAGEGNERRATLRVAPEMAEQTANFALRRHAALVSDGNGPAFFGFITSVLTRKEYVEVGVVGLEDRSPERSEFVFDGIGGESGE